MALTPVGQIVQIHPARSKDNLLPGIDGSGHDVVLMHVQGHKPFCEMRMQTCDSSFVRVRQTSSKYVVVGFAVFIHRFGLRFFTLPVKRTRRAAKHPTGLGVPPCKRANPDATHPQRSRQLYLTRISKRRTLCNSHANILGLPLNAYDILNHITFPLLFKVYKPRTRLNPGDNYKTKPELAVEIIQELQQWGFQFEVVLADSLYGESGDFISELEKLHLKYVVAIRSNHVVWLPPGQRVRYTNWRPSESVFSNGKQQTRYVREIIFGRRGRIRFYHLTTDPQTLPPESTWYIMTNVEGKIQKTEGNTYGLRTWIEYGFKHAKNELGWTDYRVTDFASIERWWETVSSAYLLVSLQCPHTQMPSEGAASPQAAPADVPTEHFSRHRWWDSGQGWKNKLNNLRLMLQPYVFHCLLLPLLLLFDIPGFRELIAIMNLFHASLPI
jgi:DDE superfamily endonuclease